MNDPKRNVSESRTWGYTRSRHGKRFRTSSKYRRGISRVIRKIRRWAAEEGVKNLEDFKL